MSSKKKNFIDKVDITICSGDGGKGAIHFLHEKYIKKGGPDGGDGGKGGDVIFICTNNYSTLFHLYHNRHYFAKNGENGKGKKCHGKNGDDIIIEVPKGTVIIDKDTNEKIYEFLINGEKFTALKGGKGGLGNTHFKSSINQAPRYAQNGEKGQKKNIILELKLLADIGLVGFPNVGKSTFLSVISAAKPEIGDYEFTTLNPQLGIANYKNETFVVADLPGIIKGASAGKGLGLQFLKHIEHVQCVALMLDSTKDYIKNFNCLQKEIKIFNSEILKKKQIIILTKCDLITEVDKQQIKKDFSKLKIKPIFISSQNKEGINECLKNFFYSIRNKT